MTDASADPLDRAAAREAELRYEREKKEERKRIRGWSDFRSQVEGVAFFLFLLPIHFVVVGRVTGWLIAHMLACAFCGMGAVSAWAKMREAEARYRTKTE